MMLSESDLYNSNTEPNNNVNPKSLGAMWINYSNGKHYICSNNTMNNNTWLDPIDILTNEINSNINNLTNDTNNRINSNKSDINVITHRVDNNNIETNNRINSINRKINEINTRIIGYNQKWYNNSPRMSDVWYQNNTSSPIAIMLTFESSVNRHAGEFFLSLDVAEPSSSGGIGTITSAGKYSGIYPTDYENMFCIVPPTFYYRASTTNILLLFWAELR